MTQKVVVVAGSSSGIGSSIARNLLDHGYRVLGFSRGERNLSDAGAFRYECIGPDARDPGRPKVHSIHSTLQGGTKS
jgi:NAD(P)-dependent dehydrogenase (short-subunit alcohol dehydrogenase family)